MATCSDGKPFANKQMTCCVQRYKAEQKRVQDWPGSTGVHCACLRAGGDEVVHELLQQRDGDVGHHHHVRDVAL